MAMVSICLYLEFSWKWETATDGKEVISQLGSSMCVGVAALYSSKVVIGDQLAMYGLV